MTSPCMGPVGTDTSVSSTVHIRSSEVLCMAPVLGRCVVHVALLMAVKLCNLDFRRKRLIESCHDVHLLRMRSKTK